MATKIPNIELPELVFGFVGAIGVDTNPTISTFESYFEAKGYRVIPIRVTGLFEQFKGIVPPKVELVNSPEKARYESSIKYGNQLREKFDDDSVLAAAAIYEIVKKRIEEHEKSGKDYSEKFEKKVYLLKQFKRPEEIELLRSVYGRLFFQVSIYSRRAARVENLSKIFAGSENTSDSNKYRTFAELFVSQDENEVGVPHGQRVSKIFHDADFIVNSDQVHTDSDVPKQVHRFCELLFGSNSISPTKFEYGMYLAKAAALRTLDLSRQVGAAIFSKNGEVVSLGSNEVPKARGGTYWSDDEYDDREFNRKIDSNEKRKKELLNEIFEALVPNENKEQLFQKKAIQNSQFMDALEYGRIVHAEMLAISDAARNGNSIKDAILYSTTFPCHMCAKHIVASGISKVVFLEPYPKSLASDLHSDSIRIEGIDRAKYSEYPAVDFEHFYGVTPRRYRELFERGKRKSDDGVFQKYIGGIARPYINMKFPFYERLETTVVEQSLKILTEIEKPTDDTSLSQ
jgi:deoxycytidylate deaminase